MEQVIKLGRYKHFKGNEYEVLYCARHSETLEDMVVYRALYGEFGVWVRPISMWNETVEHNGVVVTRFTYIGE
ncbi:MAG: DUF1653 domain-containing protein [Oscillospiraceae bacterium]